MNRKVVLTLALGALIMLLNACSDDDYMCDDKTFEPSCIDRRVVKICTHGEIARWQCSIGHVCQDGSCIKAE